MVFFAHFIIAIDLAIEEQLPPEPNGRTFGPPTTLPGGNSSTPLTVHGVCPQSKKNTNTQELCFQHWPNIIRQAKQATPPGTR